MTTANSVHSTAPVERRAGSRAGTWQLPSEQPGPFASGAAAARRIPTKGVWVAAYCVAAVLPLAAVLVGSPPGGRGLVVELASAAEVLALTLLALQLALPARLGAVARPLGAEVAIRLHRHMPDVLVAAIAAHLALVVVGDTASLALFDPLGAPWRAKAAVASCVALGALIATSVLRRRLRLSYARWRGLHNVLGIGALAFGLLHGIGVDRYLTNGAAGLTTAGSPPLASSAWPSCVCCVRVGSRGARTWSSGWRRSAAGPAPSRCAPTGTADAASGPASSPG
jgi:Ferric reductase like transmembrane component